MINYIFEAMVFIVTIACFLRGDSDYIFWLSATCVFAICTTISELIFRKYKKFKEA